MTPTPIRPSSASRQPQSDSSSNTKMQYLLVLLLAVTACTSTIAWMQSNTIAELKAARAAPVAARGMASIQRGQPQPVNPGINNQPGQPGQPGQPFVGNNVVGQFGNRGNRGAMTAATLIQRAGITLSDAQATQLDPLLAQRTQALNDAQTTARNAGNQLSPEDLAAATAAIDAQISGVVGADNFATIQPMLSQGGGRGGRGGRGGGGGGGGGG